MLSEKPRSALSDTRKVTKSTMEKKRRARINNSLVELKAILAGMVTHKGERFDKMEKADILEMTVDCVRQLQKQSRSGERVCSPSTSDSDYKSGIETCVGEVMRVLSSSEVDSTGHEMKSKLLTHISNRLGTPPSQSASFRSAFVAAISPGGIECSDGQFTTESRTHTEMEHDTCTTESMLPCSVNDESPTTTRLLPMSRPPPVLPGTVPCQVSPVYPPIQATDTTNRLLTGQSAPSVPVTILVPANIYSSQTGGTFFIPLAFSGATPYLPPQASLMDSKCTTISPGMSTVVSLPQVLSISPSYTNNSSNMSTHVYTSNTCSSNISTNISPVLVYRHNTSAEVTNKHFAQVNNAQTQALDKHLELSNKTAVPTAFNQPAKAVRKPTCSPGYTSVTLHMENKPECDSLPKFSVLSHPYPTHSYNESSLQSVFLHTNHERGDATEVSGTYARRSNPDHERGDAMEVPGTHARRNNSDQARPSGQSMWRPW